MKTQTVLLLDVDAVERLDLLCRINHNTRDNLVNMLINNEYTKTDTGDAFNIYNPLWGAFIDRIFRRIGKQTITMLDFSQLCVDFRIKKKEVTAIRNMLKNAGIIKMDRTKNSRKIKLNKD